MSRVTAGALAAAVLALLTAGGGAALAGLEALLPPYILDNFDDLVKTASAACEVLPLELLFSRRFTTELPQLDFVEYTRGSRRSYRVTHAHNKLPRRRVSNLVVYIPGWWNTPADEASQALVNSLLKQQPLVLVLDTRLAFCRGYISSASRVKALAHLLYYFIQNLSMIGVPTSSIHFIGFSLGAHVAGMTGKLVQKRLNSQLGKITALDPAKPCFARTEYRLEKRDAKFVQVVHSSAGVLGLEEPIGHADVYVNGVDVTQPECSHRSISVECDHNQAWKLYSASVVNENSMMGRRCLNWEELMNGRCSGEETVVGYACSDSSREFLKSALQAALRGFARVDNIQSFVVQSIVCVNPQHNVCTELIS